MISWLTTIASPFNRKSLDEVMTPTPFIPDLSHRKPHLRFLLMSARTQPQGYRVEA